MPGSILEIQPVHGRDMGALSKTDPLQSYRDTQIRTANQGTLIVMLYDAAIRNIGAAEEMLGQGVQGFEEVSRRVIKVQDIVTELMVSLDFERGGELAGSLFSIYMFVNRQLLDANIRKDVEPLQNARRLLSELRDAWSTIADTSKIKEGRQTGLNIEG